MHGCQLESRLLQAPPAVCCETSTGTYVYALAKLYTLSQVAGVVMRTNIVINDQLMQAAMQASGASTKREAVDLGLRMLVKLKQQQGIRAYRGKLAWQGDLEEMRLDRAVASGQGQ